MLKLFIIGWVILITAILVNGIIGKLGVTGWYDFIQMLAEKGIKTFTTLRFIDYLWLFILYPALLGIAYKSGEIIIEWLKL